MTGPTQAFTTIKKKQNSMTGPTQAFTTIKKTKKYDWSYTSLQYYKKKSMTGPT